jgi:hypothetical protein
VVVPVVKIIHSNLEVLVLVDHPVVEVEILHHNQDN